MQRALASRPVRGRCKEVYGTKSSGRCLCLSRRGDRLTLEVLSILVMLRQQVSPSFALAAVTNRSTRLGTVVQAEP